MEDRSRDGDAAFELALLAPRSGRRDWVWPSRPEVWLTLEEAPLRATRRPQRHDQRVARADQGHAVRRDLAALDIRLRRGHLHANER